jgi:cellulose synthase/poly-beta-1,6-N-acetylglucosamine synthase-like glycosyltransferase
VCSSDLQQATGEVLFFTDVRQILEPGSLRHLTSYFADPAVGAVSGELVISNGRTQAEANTGTYWKYEKWIRHCQSLIDSVDGASGCIFAMRRSLATPLPANTILDDVYLPSTVLMRGYRVLWTDGAKAFDYPTKLDVEYGRKVRTQAGIYQMLLFCPALLNPFRNPIWFHFCSHRLGRLLLPFCMIGIFAGTFGLPPGWMLLPLTCQAFFYLLAASDVYIPEGRLAKRVTSVARTCIVLVAAAFCACSILVKPQKNFWKVTRIGAECSDA